jgi:hypothetical protein
MTRIHQPDLFDCLLDILVVELPPAVESRPRSPSRPEHLRVEESKLCGGPCGQEKPMVAFARDRSRADGRKTMCRACDAVRFREWKARRLEHDPSWSETRAQRTRDLQRERDMGRPPMVTKPRTKRPYPSGAQAAARAAYPDVGPEERRHHWSYRKEHWTDIFILPRRDHHRLHSFLERDDEHLCFRAVPGGALLDTRQKHAAWAERVLGRSLSG